VIGSGDLNLKGLTKNLTKNNFLKFYGRHKRPEISEFGINTLTIPEAPEDTSYGGKLL